MPKKCRISRVDTMDEAQAIIEKAKELFTQEQSLPLFQATDFDYIEELITKIINGEISGYFLDQFKDVTTGEVVGACLFYIGAPWYNPKVCCIEELCTMSFKKGYGISRNVAAYMSYLVSKGAVDMACAGSAQPYCSKLIENSYDGAGYEKYYSYYQLSDKLIEELKAKS